jgi:hypothetical protein
MVDFENVISDSDVFKDKRTTSDFTISKTGIVCK